MTSGASSTRDLVFALTCILTARLADQFGPRPVISTTGLVLGLGYFLMSRLQTTWQLYVYCGVIISCGMSAYITMLSIVAQWFDRRRGIMTAICLSGMGIGTMIIPPIASRLISRYGWRTAYIIIAVFGFILVAGAAQFLRYPPEKIPHSVDRRRSQTGDEVFQDGAALSLKDALSNRQFWILSALYFFFLYALLTVVVHVVIHATGLAVPQKNAANILAIIGALCVLGMNAAGWSADRMGNKRTLIICFILMAFSFLVLLAANGVGSFYLFALVFGLAYGGMQVLFSPLVAELFGLRSHGVILGTAAFAGSIGAALGPFISGYIFDLTGSYSRAFIICVFMALTAIPMGAFLKPVGK